MSSAIDRANRVEMMSALVADAVLAPSMHNTQPWTFVADDSSIDLFADSTRDLQIADPQHRARTISCGAALFNLRVAAAHRGIGVRVTGFPHGPVDLTHVAHVDLDAGPVEIELAELHDAVALRHTNRNPFSDEPIPTRDLRDLELAVVERNACLEWMVDPYARHRLAELTAEATLSDTYDPVRDAERALWDRGPETVPERRDPSGRTRSEGRLPPARRARLRPASPQLGATSRACGEPAEHRRSLDAHRRAGRLARRRPGARTLPAPRHRPGAGRVVPQRCSGISRPPGMGPGSARTDAEVPDDHPGRTRTSDGGDASPTTRGGPLLPAQPIRRKRSNGPAWDRLSEDLYPRCPASPDPVRTPDDHPDRTPAARCRPDRL